MSFESLFDASYERVLLKKIDGRDFFAGFYLRFLRASPEIRAKFHATEMEKQQRMLKKSFYSLLVFYASNQADDYLKKTAQMHDRHHLDIPPHFYDIWLETLVSTVQAYDDGFNDEVELAWRLVLAPGITYMKFLHQHKVDPVADMDSSGRSSE
ncbi:hypothetical protein TDB9533_04481 [Thalassocella blandensis]|nr:hypothetical protein TDB9533_04481 [Thalassocella blandensis]